MTGKLGTCQSHVIPVIRVLQFFSSSVLQLEISWISSSIWLSIVDVNHVVSSAQTPPVIRSERFPPSVTGQEQIQNLGSSQL